MKAASSSRSRSGRLPGSDSDQTPALRLNNWLSVTSDLISESKVSDRYEAEEDNQLSDDDDDDRVQSLTEERSDWSRRLLGNI